MERTPRSTVHRLPKRGAYDEATIFQILDEGMVAHVGFIVDETPFVIPMNYGRDHDRMLLHGSIASRMMQSVANGIDVCATVTLLDGLVLARSAFHHSMNYRSVVVLGRATAIIGGAEKEAALRAISEHVVPGQWDVVRKPTAIELDQTLVLALPISEASAKVRSGPPVDDTDDLALPIWAGEIPLRIVALPPVADEHSKSDPPAHVTGWRR